MAEFDLSYDTEVVESYEDEIDDDKSEYDHMFSEFDELHEADTSPLEPLDLEGEFEGDIPDVVEVTALDEMLESENDWDAERSADLERMFEVEEIFESVDETNLEQVENENFEEATDWESEREIELERMLKELEELEDTDDDDEDYKVLIKRR